MEITKTHTENAKINNKTTNSKNHYMAIHVYIIKLRYLKFKLKEKQ